MAPVAPAFGVRSMTAPLRRVLVIRPATDGDWDGAGWRRPDVDALLRQHAAFAELLAGLGVDVVVRDAPAGLIDCCFAYDACFTVGSGAIELRMVKPARAPEPPAVAGLLAELGIPIVGRLEAPAHADGGDMCWLDPQTLAVGRGYRTNAAAHAQLAALLAPEGVTVERFDLPHFQGAAHVLHLMSFISPVADDLAMVYEPLCPVPLLEALDARGIRRVACPDEEFAAQGCNILAARPGVIVMADSCPEARRRLEEQGCEVHVYAAEQTNRGDGGPTCLTRPLLRG